MELCEGTYTRIAGDAVLFKSACTDIVSIIASQKTIGGTTVISAQVNGVAPSLLRELAEQIGTKNASGIVVLDVASNGNVALVGFESKELQKKFHAGNIIKKVAEIVGGSGGGRPDLHKLEARTPKR